MNSRIALLLICTGVMSLLAVAPASVHSQAPFYQGKTIKIVRGLPDSTRLAVVLVSPAMRA